MESTAGDPDNAIEHSPLLSLPPELRNEIYRYALVEGPIYINPSNTHHFQEPALLQVSQQIRAECKQIYYCENHFMWSIVSFNANAVIHWMSADKGRLNPRHSFAHTGPPKWANLLPWLKEFYTGAVVGIATGIRNPASTGVEVAARMFQVVKKLRVFGSEDEWGTINLVLEEMRQAAGVYDEAWIKDD